MLLCLLGVYGPDVFINPILTPFGALAALYVCGLAVAGPLGASGKLSCEEYFKSCPLFVPIAWPLSPTYMW